VDHSTFFNQSFYISDLERTSRSGHNQLIEGKAFTTCFDDSSSGGLSEFESGDGHLWYLKKSIVISDGANYNSDFIPKIIKTFRSYFLSILTVPSKVEKPWR
jgi:hypothetical protein